MILGGLLIVLAIALAYANSLAGSFVFDDPLAITENPTIRRLWPLTEVLFPPRGEGYTVEGRPILNLTLALNYAWGGTSVRGYHIVNIAIHAGAALVLFGVMRRTLLLPRLRPRFGTAALPLAWVTALLWSLHPLQTESVTYVVQRAESLVSLFYLLTLYCFVRALPDDGGRTVLGGTWSVLSVMACIVGMATKEIMVSAPLLVLLFDWIFVAGDFREVLRRRRAIHGALFSTWLLLAVLVARTGTRGGTAGFGINVTPWHYVLTQFEAITRYAGLSFWPHPLVFDYGVAWVRSLADVLPFLPVPLALIGGTIFAGRRWPAVAFLGILFFAVLSPTSSIVPGNRQTIAEHRMYLPLATLGALLACGTYLAVRGSRLARPVFFAGVSSAVAFGVLTAARNEDYRSELALYRDTAVKRPRNGFARYNLGRALAGVGRHTEAIPEYEASLKLMPGVAPVHNNLANSLTALGRLDEARLQLEAALQFDPNYANARFNLGNLLLRLGDKAGAREQFRRAVLLDPRHLEARENLGGILLESGRLDEAKLEFDQILRIKPESVEAHFGLGNIFLLQEHWSDAAREFETVIALRPDLTVARERLELARKKVSR